MEQNNKQNIILNTIGRDRTDCIESMKTITRQNDYNNYQHLRVENERYYDSLDNAKPKNDLKLLNPLHYHYDLLMYPNMNLI